MTACHVPPDAEAPNPADPPAGANPAGPRHGTPHRPSADLPVVALVGRPNVGKSTFLARASGRFAETTNAPGTTVGREVREVRTRAGRALLVDLPGTGSLGDRPVTGPPFWSALLAAAPDADPRRHRCRRRRPPPSARHRLPRPGPPRRRGPQPCRRGQVPRDRPGRGPARPASRPPRPAHGRPHRRGRGRDRRARRLARQAPPGRARGDPLAARPRAGRHLPARRGAGAGRRGRRAAHQPRARGGCPGPERPRRPRRGRRPLPAGSGHAAPARPRGPGPARARRPLVSRGRGRPATTPTLRGPPRGLEHPALARPSHPCRRPGGDVRPRQRRGRGRGKSSCPARGRRSPRP